jgi:hypothetical protein
MDLKWRTSEVPQRVDIEIFIFIENPIFWCIHGLSVYRVHIRELSVYRVRTVHGLSVYRERTC